MSIYRYVPKMYKKNIFEIDYNLLKSKGIKCIIFDLDNTLLIFDEQEISKETVELINKLKKDFNVVVISNNFKKRILTTCEKIDVDFVSFAMKPLSKGFNRIKKKYNYKNEELCIIGDQIMSDILGGNKAKIMTILVEPLSDNDLKVTKFNRLIEKKILNNLKTKGILERGKYYES